MAPRNGNVRIFAPDSIVSVSDSFILDVYYIAILNRIVKQNDLHNRAIGCKKTALIKVSGVKGSGVHIDIFSFFS